MIKKEITLTPLCFIGSCRALIEDDSVSIRAFGVSGCMKAWLTGSVGSIELGNLVNGSLTKRVSTLEHSGVLITQSGRQLFYGKFRDEPEESEHSDAENDPAPSENRPEECEQPPENPNPPEECEPTEAETPEHPPEKPEECEQPAPQSAESPARQDSRPPFSFNDGFTWRRISSKTYPSDSLSVRYILSHRSFYNAYLLHNAYFYGENGDKIAIAIECDLKNEPHPMPHLASYSVLRDGLLIVCADLSSKNFYTYEY